MLAPVSRGTAEIGVELEHAACACGSSASTPVIVGRDRTCGIPTVPGRALRRVRIASHRSAADARLDWPILSAALLAYQEEPAQGWPLMV